jgi:aconitate hydratase
MPASLSTAAGEIGIIPLSDVADRDTLGRLPITIRIFLENILRYRGNGTDDRHVAALLDHKATVNEVEIPFRPGRVLLQDFTGVPVIADLAAMRDGVHRWGGDIARVNPQVPVDLVIDHSVQVDVFRSADSYARNVAFEVSRNGERYRFLKWAQGAFDNLRVVPPGMGIVHQVNLESLATVVVTRDGVAFPDTLVGTDSHTTMIGGVGVLGWGVGGIEAEAAMLGEPIAMSIPPVVGVRLTGELPEGATATDLVLALTELLRAYGVVGKLVEFFGPGLAALSVPDRATVSNMSPEYGATEGFFPVDAQTLAYLRGTGRSDDLVDLVERYCKEQTLFVSAGDPEPVFAELLSFDLHGVVPSMAGPRRPQDRVPLAGVRRSMFDALPRFRGSDGPVTTLQRATVHIDGQDVELADGSVAIAAITSCTNTSNPSVMLAAGLLARNAVARGLRVPPTVKTSLAPGSQVVIDYLERADLLTPLEQLGFFLVGFGCTTCIGNSGPLPDEVADAVVANDLAVAAVLSGNRNFEGRVHPQVKMSFLASPPLCVAYAIAGTIDIDLTTEPLGFDQDGKPVLLSDIWPDGEEVAILAERSLNPEWFRTRYATIFDGDASWRALDAPAGERYLWEDASTYIKEPPFLVGLPPNPPEPQPLRDARCLVLVGDSITTDHISPAGSIAQDSPAGTYLMDHAVERKDFNSYGSRRGNHEVMMRGTFANIRLRNLLVPGSEGGVTRGPDGSTMSIYDAAMEYQAGGLPLIVLAGTEYGSGSSRDWAAKGTALLGVRAVIAKSYERIHRSNLVQMGVVPLQFLEGDDANTLGLTGRESFTIEDLAEPRANAQVEVVANAEDGSVTRFRVLMRLDTETDVSYIRHGGILPFVLRRLAS